MIINKYIVRPYHTPVIKITSDSSEIIQSLCLQYGEYINDDKTDDFFELMILMSHDDKAVPKYVLQYGNNIIYTDNPLQEIDNIIFSKTQYDQKVFALHAAAVKYNHKVHVFIAPTKTGKTTLTSFLSSSGFDYVTDDLVLLLMDNLYVHPYTTPIQLRGGGLDVLKTCNIFPKNLIPLDIPNNKRYVYMPENCMKEPLPLGNIYFIGRSETENIATVLSVTKAVAELMKSPITSYPVTSEYLRFLSRLAKMGCKRLLYKDMEYVSNIIKQEGDRV